MGESANGPGTLARGSTLSWPHTELRDTAPQLSPRWEQGMGRVPASPGLCVQRLKGSVFIDGSGQEKEGSRSCWSRRSGLLDLALGG